MPTATESGSVLGLAYELHSNSRRQRRFGVTRCVLTMAAGAVVARLIVKWDEEAQRRRQQKIKS